MRLHSYSSVFALGHRAVGELLRGRVVVCEEKVDGSQITFGVVGGELVIRSKGAEIFADAPERIGGTPDVIQFLGETFRNEARWQKAVQHLRERGAIDGTLRDIGSLIKEVPADIEKEATDEIKERLFHWAWPQIRRIAVAGLPEWYKQKLVTEQFAETTDPI